MYKLNSSNKSEEKSVKLSELISGLSRALDITEGLPIGHCERSCWIGMHIGKSIGLSQLQLWELFYTLLLKDLGCSCNASNICKLYLSDDLQFKRDFKLVGDKLPEVVGFVLQHTGLNVGLARRFKSTLNIFKNGAEISRQLILTRCERGAEIARLLRYSDDVANGISSLDEHWNGKGKPCGLAGNRIPIYSRIALLSQVVDVFFTGGSKDAALEEVTSRSGEWFDPMLVDAINRIGQNDDFWNKLASTDLERHLISLVPTEYEVSLDDDYLDDIATAFGQVIDSKSSFTNGHSERVALYTDMIAQKLGLDAHRRRWLRRGALLHDIGKLGVSNNIWDKESKLDSKEMEQMRRHVVLSESILSRISVFSELAEVIGAHCEQPDGNGYPRGRIDLTIPLEARIIATADIFDAMTSVRPHRAAMPMKTALDNMRQDVDRAIDAVCFDALCQSLEGQI